MKNQNSRKYRLSISLMPIGLLTVIVSFLLVMSAWAGTFKDDFEDGNFERWRLHKFGDQSSQWFVKDGELVCVSKNICAVESTLITDDNTWRDYEIECQFKIEQTFIPACVQRPPSVGVGVHSDDTNQDSGIYLSITQQNGVWDTPIGIAGQGQNFQRKPPVGKITLKEGQWYTAQAIALGNRYQMFIDDEQIYDFQVDFPDKGRAGIFARNCEAHFDNVIITGDDIPNVRPSGYAVQPKSKFSITWGQIKEVTD